MYTRAHPGVLLADSAGRTQLGGWLPSVLCHGLLLLDWPHRAELRAGSSVNQAYGAFRPDNCRARAVADRRPDSRGRCFADQSLASCGNRGQSLGRTQGYARVRPRWRRENLRTLDVRASRRGFAGPSSDRNDANRCEGVTVGMCTRLRRPCIRVPHIVTT
ncbi:hypothetical protein BC834DRAFT_275949 [Gloeopeniophorella convolvens]|nr:hypothetical protein BC834DRAFT_275949 [Gloeopeniophorella convolvens]